MSITPSYLRETLSSTAVAEEPVIREPRNQLAQEILENLANFPHCVLLTRVGQFYEVCLVIGHMNIGLDIKISRILGRLKRSLASFR